MSTSSNFSPTPKFELGRVLATPGALRALQDSGQSPAEFVNRHIQGDWGSVEECDWQLNDQSLEDGARLLSAYTTLRGEKIWIITEAVDEHGRRVSTTVLLPDEY